MTADPFNLTEGFFWLLIAAVLLSASWRKQQFRRYLIIAALLFILFGVSDFVEVHTGVWWRPWWLFVWNAACLIGLLVDYYWYRKAIKRSL